ncbi:MAG: class I SAM-dependent methyltransferase [Candidatus Eisenbacteria bacterium]
MSGYYEEKLAAERLAACYDIAPPRTRDYLAAETAHVRERAAGAGPVLELGCGYGRMLRDLRARGRRLHGLDTSATSLAMARSYVGDSGLRLLRADARRPGFRDGVFDLTFCAQNGVSAFRVDRRELVAAAVRVTRPGGRVLFSSYAEAFWEDRLEWFRAQAAAGLLGPIDEEATGEGVIVCEDGFRAETVGPAEFRRLAESLGLVPVIREIDGSSLFCEITVPAP